jgi:hypothetical protein
MTIKFNKHHVTNGEIKARVFYSLDNRTDNKPCVTIYSKDYNMNLGKILPQGYKNDSDMQSDYSDAGRVVLLENHPLYKIARERAEKN